MSLYEVGELFTECYNRCLVIVLDTLRLTFTANVKPLANFLFYNSIIMVFTKFLNILNNY